MNGMLMNWAILLIGCHFLRCRGGKALLKSGGSAALGSGIETAAFVVSRSTAVLVTVAIAVTIPLMTLLCFGRSSFRRYVENCALCLGITILMGGLVTALEQRLGFGQMPFLTGILAVLVADIFLHWLYGVTTVQKKLCAVHLFHSGHQVDCSGLMDSGNQLRTADKSRGVHIVSAELLERLGLAVTDMAGITSYESLGRPDGVLALYQLDELRVELGDGRQAVEVRPVVADGGKGFLAGKAYQMILHTGFLETEEFGRRSRFQRTSGRWETEKNDRINKRKGVRGA